MRALQVPVFTCNWGYSGISHTYMAMTNCRVLYPCWLPYAVIRRLQGHPQHTEQQCQLWVLPMGSAAPHTTAAGSKLPHGVPSCSTGISWDGWRSGTRQTAQQVLRIWGEKTHWIWCPSSHTLEKNILPKHILSSSLHAVRIYYCLHTAPIQHEQMGTWEEHNTPACYRRFPNFICVPTDSKY